MQPWLESFARREEQPVREERDKIPVRNGRPAVLPGTWVGIDTHSKPGPQDTTLGADISCRPNHGVENGHIVQLLKEVTATLELNAANYSTRSIRIGGSTALLNGGANPLVIKLLGRWLSDCHQSYIPRVNRERHRVGFEADVLTSGWSVFGIDDWLGGFPSHHTQERGLAYTKKEQISRSDVLPLNYIVIIYA
jgi:hypothetical protein